ALVGIHLNAGPVSLRACDMSDLTQFEELALADREVHRSSGVGYSTQQATRPQTLGYGLADSPAGQAAWIIEKFWAWTDCDGHPENVLTRDELLDNVMLYWLPGTGASSGRLYWESFNDFTTKLAKIDVPTGVLMNPHEIIRPSRRWAEARFSDIRRWT